MIKITVKTIKPRAKRVNDILLSKRCERHSDPRNPSRSEIKKQTKQLIKDYA